jgi:hypothetical protein
MAEGATLAALVLLQMKGYSSSSCADRTKYFVDKLFHHYKFSKFEEYLEYHQNPNAPEIDSYLVGKYLENADLRNLSKNYPYAWNQVLISPAG